MKITLVLFKIDFDRYSALATDIAPPNPVWKAVFECSRDLVFALEDLGLLTSAELRKVRDGSSFETGTCLFHVSIDADRLARAGFRKVVPRR